MQITTPAMMPAVLGAAKGQRERDFEIFEKSNILPIRPFTTTLYSDNEGKTKMTSDFAISDFRQKSDFAILMLKQQ